MVITKREDVTKQGFCLPPRRLPLGFQTNEPQRTSAGSRKTLMMTLAQEGDSVFSFSWGHFNSQEKLKTMLIQNFGVTNEEHCGMLWYFSSGQFGGGALWEIWKWRMNTFFSCKSTNQNQDIHRPEYY